MQNFFQLKILEDKIIFKIIVATIPAIVVGYFIFDIVNLYFRNIEVVAYSSIFFALLLFVSDRKETLSKNWSNINFYEAFIIGLIQILAFIPGASRAGVTITGARFLGFNRI